MYVKKKQKLYTIEIKIKFNILQGLKGAQSTKAKKSFPKLFAAFQTGAARRC